MDFPTTKLEDTQDKPRTVFYWDNAGLFAGFNYVDLAPGQPVPPPPRWWLWSQVRVNADYGKGLPNGQRKEPWQKVPSDVWLDGRMVNRKPVWWNGGQGLDPNGPNGWGPG